MERYDALVIGGGPGGYVCALRLAKNGKKALLIEKEEVGGTCLNHGCIPTKALLGSAAAVRTLDRGDEFGFSVGEVAVDYRAAHVRSRKAVSRLVSGVQGLLNKNGVDLITDTARLTAAKTVETEKHGSFAAKDIVLATGAMPVVLSLFGELGSDVLYPRDALALDNTPKSAVIVGAGAIGVEFAYLWSVYGCQVTLIEAADRILPSFDREIGDVLNRELRKTGIDIRTARKVGTARRCSRGIAVSVEGEWIEAEKLLVSAGIRPATDGLGVDAAGVRLDERGCIRVDDRMKTSAEGIYAIGDVTGMLPLAHVASAQGILAADTICGRVTEPLDYFHIPKCVYCVPEAAMLGRTEEELIREKISFTVGKYFFNGNGKAIGEGEANGFVKVLAAADTREIIGVHMVGPHVSELITQCGILMRYEVTADEAEKIIFPHPSLSEVVMESLNGAGGNAIHQ